MLITMPQSVFRAAGIDTVPVEIKRKGYGAQVVLNVPAYDTFESWMNELAIAACEAADRNEPAVAETIYRAMEKCGRWQAA